MVSAFTAKFNGPHPAKMNNLCEPAQPVCHTQHHLAMVRQGRATSTDLSCAHCQLFPVRTMAPAGVSNLSGFARLRTAGGTVTSRIAIPCACRCAAAAAKNEWSTARTRPAYSSIMPQWLHCRFDIQIRRIALTTSSQSAPSILAAQVSYLTASRSRFVRQAYRYAYHQSKLQTPTY